MQTQTDPLDDFGTHVAHRLHYWSSLEFSCLALRIGSEWVQFAGRAALGTEQCQPNAKISPIVDFPDFRAYSGRLPAKTVADLIKNLKNSLVIPEKEDVRLAASGSRAYLWTQPSVRESSTGRWPSVLSTTGEGPHLDFVLWQTFLADIDKRLRHHRPPFNGFAALEARLGLGSERQTLNPFFDLCAQIPARFLSSEVDRRHHSLAVRMEYSGAAELLVEWLPQREAQAVTIPASRTAGSEEHEVSIPIPGDATEAEARLLIIDEDADKLTQGVSCESILLQVCEFFDQGQTHLSEFLYTENNLRNANAFELGVARLLSLGGYTVLWFGKAVKEALPDLVAYARTPRGAEYLIYIECTLKNPGEKFSDFARRAAELRSYLGPQGKGLLPVVFVRNQVTDQDRRAAFGMGLGLSDGEDIRELQEAIRSDEPPGEIFDRLRYVSPHIAFSEDPSG